MAKRLPNEIASLSTKDKESLKSLLERLQTNPYSVVAEAHVSGEFFASRVSKGTYLYWSIDYPDDLSLIGPLRIKLLALRNVAERSRASSVGNSK